MTWLFTAIDDGAHTAAAIAKRTSVSERGARILCDYLTVNRLLAKSDSTYQLVPESAAFLSKRSPAYLGTIANFLQAVALHSHALDDVPRLFYMHFWANGDAVKLAKVLRGAVDVTNSAK